MANMNLFENSLFDFDFPELDASTGFVGVTEKVAQRYCDIPPHFVIEPLGEDRYGNTRYCVKDKNTGNIISDAKGWGYRSEYSAKKGAFYHANKEVFEEDKKACVDFINAHKDYFYKKYEDMLIWDRSRERETDPEKEKEVFKEYGKELLSRVRSQKFNDEPKNMRQIPGLLYRNECRLDTYESGDVPF